MKIIEIIISSSGESRLETRGFRGSECREASRFLEVALGKKSSEALTAEFHEAEVHQANQIQQER